MQRSWAKSVRGMCEEQGNQCGWSPESEGRILLICVGVWGGMVIVADQVGPCNPLTLEFALREMGKHWKVLHKSDMI